MEGYARYSSTMLTAFLLVVDRFAVCTGLTASSKHLPECLVLLLLLLLPLTFPQL